MISVPLQQDSNEDQSKMGKASPKGPRRRKVRRRRVRRGADLLVLWSQVSDVKLREEGSHVSFVVMETGPRCLQVVGKTWQQDRHDDDCCVQEAITATYTLESTFHYKLTFPLEMTCQVAIPDGQNIFRKVLAQLLNFNVK